MKKEQRIVHVVFVAWVTALLGLATTSFGQEFGGWDKVFDAGAAYINGDEQGHRWHASGAYARQQELQKEIDESKRKNDIAAYHRSLDEAQSLMNKSCPLLAIESFTDGFVKARDAYVTARVGSEQVNFENLFPRSDNRWPDMLRVSMFKKADDTYGRISNLLEKLDAQAAADLAAKNNINYLWHEEYRLALMNGLEPATSISSDFQRTFKEWQRRERTRLTTWKKTIDSKQAGTLIDSASALTDWSRIIELFLAGREKDAAPLICEACLNGGSESITALGKYVADAHLKGLPVGPFSIDAVDARGRTVAHLAVLQSDPVALQIFLALGADPAIKDRDGKTAAELIPASKAELFNDYSLADGWKDSDANRKRVDGKMRTLAKWVYACADSSPFPSDNALAQLEFAWSDVYLNRLSGNDQYRQASFDASKVLILLNLQFMNKLEIKKRLTRRLPESKVAANIEAVEKLKAICAKSLADANDAANKFSTSLEAFEVSWGANGKAAVNYAKAEGVKYQSHDQVVPEMLR